MARRIQQRRMAGEGSMYRWREYWAMDVELPRLADGKRRRKKLYAKTTALLLEKRRAFELESGGLLQVELETLTVEQLLDAWLEHAVKIKNRENTYESSYEPIVRIHLRPALGRYKVKKLTTAQGQALINEKYKEGLKPRTLRNIRAVLRKALNQAKAWYGLQVNIADAIEVPPAEKPHYRTLNAHEAQAFLNALIGHRLEALYWTAILMGLRECELIGLREADIDLVAGLMRVQQQIRRLKGKRDERTPTKSGKEQVLTIPSILVSNSRRRLRELASTPRGSVFMTSDIRAPLSLSPKVSISPW
jgi:integrase